MSKTLKERIDRDDVVKPQHERVNRSQLRIQIQNRDWDELDDELDSFEKM